MACTIALSTGSLEKPTRRLFRRFALESFPPRQAWIRTDFLDYIFQIVWLHPREIPSAVHDRFVDGGLVGADVYNDWHFQFGLPLELVSDFDYSKSKFGDVAYLGLIALVDGSLIYKNWHPRRAAVSDYPYWTRHLLRSDMEVIPKRGGVEAFVGRQSEFGVTVIDTGDTVRANPQLQIIRKLAAAPPGLYVREDCSKAIREQTNILVRELKTEFCSFVMLPPV